MRQRPMDLPERLCLRFTLGVLPPTRHCLARCRRPPTSPAGGDVSHVSPGAGRNSWYGLCDRSTGAREVEEHVIILANGVTRLRPVDFLPLVDERSNYAEGAADGA